MDIGDDRLKKIHIAINQQYHIWKVQTFCWFLKTGSHVKYTFRAFNGIQGILFFRGLHSHVATSITYCFIKMIAILVILRLHSHFDVDCITITGTNLPHGYKLSSNDVFYRLCCMVISGTRGIDTNSIFTGKNRYWEGHIIVDSIIGAIVGDIGWTKIFTQTKRSNLDCNFFYIWR